MSLLKFSVDTSFVTFTTPGKLQGISKALFEREKAKAEAMWVEAAVEVKNVLREGMAALVEKLAEKLKSKPDGKRQTFHDTLVTNMTDFLDVFESRNIADDAELKALVEKAKGLLAGKDALILRSDDGMRERMAESFESIRSEIGSLLVDRPSRMLNLED